MPFGPAYSRTKTFAALGSLLATDLNSMQDDLGTQIEKHAPENTVSALPGSPVDGQICYYQSAAMLTDGVVWKFRYNSGSASAYKWEFVGGPAWGADVDTGEVISSATFVDAATVGPSVVVPLAGDYQFDYGAQLVASAGAGAYAAATLQIGASVPGTDGDAIFMNAVAAGTDFGNPARRRRKNALAATTTVKLVYRRFGGNGSAGDRWITALPIRVG